MRFDGKQFIFLDRDGVINRKLPEGSYITLPEQLELLPGVPEAIAELNRAHRRVIVVTNQRSIALGLLTEEGLFAIQQHLRDLLSAHGAHIDAIYHCPHDRNECACRKPGTAMIENAFRDFPEANAQNSILIGDSLSDIEAGRRVGMPTIFIEGDPEHRKPGAERAVLAADAVTGSLSRAVHELLLAK